MQYVYTAAFNEGLQLETCEPRQVFQISLQAALLESDC